ncbi:MAG TPA: hemolysin family protein [Gemmatimonadaceae bacterium]|nr:hemolysin family protein [Gemmatimonadaceae bacterium]
MNLVALVVALAALAVGALAAAADGALLSVADVPSAPGAEGPTGGFRDLTHRSLGIARLVAHLVCGVSAAIAVDVPHRPAGIALLLVVGIAVVVAVLGEIAPRAAGDAFDGRALAALGGAVRTIEATVRPLVAGGAAVDRALRRLFPPVSPGEVDRDVTAAQFRQVVQAEAEMPGAQRAILHRVFSLADTEVRDVMVPRVDILGIETGTPWSEVLDRVRSSQHARMPVYEETLDHITGILFAKDLLLSVIAGEEPAAGWESLVRPATFIPESKPIDAQLRDFKATRSHIAIVVDEFGGTAGLVTIEDIIEEIVGDIRDEHDREEPEVESEEGRRFWVSGRVTLDELSDLLGHRFDRDDVSTVGGLVFELVGHVPRAGQELTLDGYRVVVERVVRRRVDRVYFERLEPAVERQS